MFTSLDFNDPLVCHLFDSIMKSNDAEDEFFLTTEAGKRKLYESTDDEGVEDDEMEEEVEEEEEEDGQIFLGIRHEFRESNPTHARGKAKKLTKKTFKIGYSGAHLTNELIKTELMIQNDSLLIHALQELGEVIYLHKSDDSMRFIYGFNLLNQEIPDQSPTLTLTILKGSIFTTLFSTIARYDDEYLLELNGLDDNETTLLWIFKGYLHQKQSVESSEVDWNKMKILQDHLQINYIGSYSFTKILSQIVLSLPLCEREGQRYDPMPATIMMDYVFRTTFPVELIGFQHNEIMTNSDLLHLVYDFVDVDGRGNAFPAPLLNPSSDIGCDDIASLRVVEIRKLASDFRVKGGLVIVYGTCSVTIPHRRYICTEIYELRQDVTDTSKGPLLPVTLLTEEEWINSPYSHITGDLELEQISCQSTNSTMEFHPLYDKQDLFPLYSSEISFFADSYWGSDAYHHHIQRSTLPVVATDLPITPLPSLPIPPPPSPVPSSSAHSTIRHVDANRWLVGDLVYIPAAQWFEPAKLYRYPHSEKMFLSAHVIKRTHKQVTLHVPALARDITRGFGFMERTVSPRGQGDDWLLLSTPQDLIRFFT